MLLGKKEGEHHFCSNACLHNFKHPSYCPDCVAETSDDAAGSTMTWNGIGVRLFGNKAECPTCYSVIRRKWLCVLFIPVIPFKRYRVRYNTPTVYFSREIKPDMLRLSEQRTQAQIHKS